VSAPKAHGNHEGSVHREDARTGKPTGPPVATVVAMVADGMTIDDILAEHPDLEIDDIAEAHARTSPNGEGCGGDL